MNAQDVLALCQEHRVEVVDFRFVDFPGQWQHFSIPMSVFDADMFEEGLGFDGSSIRGWRGIQESDMLMIPDPRTAFIDPFSKRPTLVLISDIYDPITREAYPRDPRNVAKKAEEFLRSTGIGDTAYFGPEAEFFIFDDIRYHNDQRSAFYTLDSIEGHWNTGRDEGPNLGHKPRYKEGYFPCPPVDKFQDLRNDMVANLRACGIEVEAQHHEVATAGQAEIDVKFDTLVRMADKMQVFKYVIKNTAYQAGKSVTFMPKPLFGDNGSGMHVHLSIWKDGENLFAGDHYAGLSENGLFAIGGILHHAPALIALTNPTTNSFKRLVPGYEAPTRLAYSSRNRSAAIRIPMASASPNSKRIEFRCPDPAANSYLCFSALMMAVIDGIKNKIDPGQPFDKNLYDLPPEELAEVPETPHDLSAALDALERDHEFLLAGDVFTHDSIQNWIDYKRVREVEALSLRPHPFEFSLYYDL